MFSKEEAAKIKKEFWTISEKSFTENGFSYDTKIKDFALNSIVITKKAEFFL